MTSHRRCSISGSMTGGASGSAEGVLARLAIHSSTFHPSMTGEVVACGLKLVAIFEVRTTSDEKDRNSFAYGDDVLILGQGQKRRRVTQEAVSRRRVGTSRTSRSLISRS